MMGCVDDPDDPRERAKCGLGCAEGCRLRGDIADGVIEVRNEADKDALNAKLSGFRVVFSEPKDTIGSAIDALNAGIAMVNAASERMKAFGLSPQISVNGTDYGDKVSVRLDGDLVR